MNSCNVLNAEFKFGYSFECVLTRTGFFHRMETGEMVLIMASPAVTDVE